MPIRRGEDWGERGPLAPGAPVARTDAEVIDALEAGIGGEVRPEVGLLGGDLYRNLGSPAPSEAALRRGEGIRLPMDVACVDLVLADGRTLTGHFVAHMVAIEGRGRYSLFARRTLVVMNASFRGEADLGPRAHPNDGLLDVTDGRLPVGDRLRAARRMRTGAHLPHPALATSRVRELEVEFDRPAVVELDGRPSGTVKALSVRCLVDAVTVVA